MRRKTLLFSLLLVCIHSVHAQNGFNFSCSRDTIVSGCTNSCITLQTRIPALYGGATQFSVIPGNTLSGNCYQAATITQPGGAGTPSGLTIDDRYSSPINLGFAFNFFGNTYNQVVVSTNGLISFDVSLAGNFSHYAILNSGGFLSATNGTPQDLPSNLYDRALIMGAYQDLNPALTTSPNQKIQYTTVGTAPYRKFIFSFFRVPQFQCNTLIENTQQIILNESTGIIEVLIYSRQPCTTWNEGRAMIGLQDFSRTQSVMVPGRRASDPAWTVTSPNNNTVPTEAYSFIPSGGTGSVNLFKRVELYDLQGNLVTMGTTTNLNNGTLQASFPNVCSPTGTTTFVVKSVYQKNDNPSAEVFGFDTIRVVKNNATLQATTATQPTSCTANTGSVTFNVTAGNAPYTYSINGGAYQSGNSFTGLAQGFYPLSVKDNFGCVYNFNATVGLNNTATVSVRPKDTALCVGASFTPRVTSNATSFSWTPTTGVSAPTTAQPVITPAAPGKYIITAQLGNCLARDTINVTQFPTTPVNAGPDQTIILGDQVQLTASGTPGSTWTWTPATALSAANVLQPIASPTQTTTYTIRQVTPQGCTTVDSALVTVLTCIDPQAAFSPNGDGVNDRWLVTTGACLKSAEVEVYNRYGALVYRNRQYTNQWDGTYEGKPLPDGTYYYVVRFTLINGKPREFKGNVTILR